MTFQIGDKVRHGTHIGTVTDVGTLFVLVKTTDGTARAFCPWELVKIHAAHNGLRPRFATKRVLPCSVR
jgi:hypothetical protein